MATGHIYLFIFGKKQHRTANRFISTSAAMVSTGKLSTTALLFSGRIMEIRVYATLLSLTA